MKKSWKMGLACLSILLFKPLFAEDPKVIVSCSTTDSESVSHYVTIYEPNDKAEYPIDIGSLKKTGKGTMKIPAGGRLDFEDGYVAVRVLAGAQEDIVGILKLPDPPEPLDLLCSWHLKDSLSWLRGID
jgi:hypothetical protein